MAWLTVGRPRGRSRGLRGLGGPLADQQQALRLRAYQLEQEANKAPPGFISPARAEAARLREQADAMIAAVQRETMEARGTSIAAPDTRVYTPTGTIQQMQAAEMARRGVTIAAPRVYSAPSTERATAVLAPPPTWTIASQAAPGAPLPAPPGEPVPVGGPGAPGAYQPQVTPYQPGLIASAVGQPRASSLGPMPAPVRYEAPRVATAPISSSLLGPGVLAAAAVATVLGLIIWSRRMS